jgi:hypothetical protein
MMRITRDRISSILGPAPKPKTVWEKQFDGFDSELAALAKLDWWQLQEQDLWFYLLDLAYVELQPDLFRHLFPACLKFWYESLMRGEPAEAGDSEFHYALIHGDIMQKMLTPIERMAVIDFFRDGFLDCVDLFPSLPQSGSYFAAYAWLRRFNSIGLMGPIIQCVWEEWWALDSPGKAFSALIYASGIIYERHDNSVASKFSPQRLPLTEDDAQVFDRGWRAENLDFFRSTLTPEYIQRKVAACETLLVSHPASQLAVQMLNDSKLRTEFIDFRLKRLISNLSQDSLQRDYWD